jgi:hypothetical protein
MTYQPPETVLLNQAGGPTPGADVGQEIEGKDGLKKPQNQNQKATWESGEVRD